MDHSAAVTALSALAHGHRLAVFRLLVVRGPSGALAGEIACEVGMGATAASFHLKELDRAGLVVATRQGRNIRYALHVEGVRRLLTFLTEDCCRGQPEICGTLFQPSLVVMLETADAPDAPCCSPARGAKSGSSPEKISPLKTPPPKSTSPRSPRRGKPKPDR